MGEREYNPLDVPTKESLIQAASQLLEECRMVLPGIQALFGFQLIAVFNAKFWELCPTDRLVHLLAIGLVAIAIALVMTPAAYHRLAFQNAVSRSFIEISSRLLLGSMFPLMLGICLDFYLISTMILSNAWWGLGLSLALLSIFGSLWFGLPYFTKASQRV
ncbi:MAG TPA: DUF6328 family protein [Nitrospira sp.]|nr:DUF6328 family protein [Nitrospira sp.]